MFDRLIGRLYGWFARKWAEAQLNDIEGDPR